MVDNVQTQSDAHPFSDHGNANVELEGVKQRSRASRVRPGPRRWVMPMCTCPASMELIFPSWLPWVFFYSTPVTLSNSWPTLELWCDHGFCCSDVITLRWKIYWSYLRRIKKHSSSHFVKAWPFSACPVCLLYFLKLVYFLAKLDYIPAAPLLAASVYCAVCSLSSALIVYWLSVQLPSRPSFISLFFAHAGT